MNCISKCLLAALLSATIFLSAAGVNAMTFPQFDHMAAQDRQDYLNCMEKRSIDSSLKLVQAVICRLAKRNLK